MSSRGEAGLLQQHGQNLYRQGSFEAAIKAFTEALKCPDVDALAVLDNRAATYTKLLRYDQALRDSRQMIKQDKHDDRGYLRCAKALLLDGKPEKALDVYAYALKTLSNNHPRRQTVEQLHDKLHDKLTAKCYDPFTVLPLEIAEMVLQHFTFRQIVSILRVSKGWDQFLTSKRDLWMRVDLSNARSKVHWTSPLAYIRRSKAMLTQAVVVNLSTPSVRKTLEYFSRCPNLEHLEIWCPFNPDGILELFRGSKQLRVLLISADTPIPQSTTAKLLASLPRLERIEIHRSTTSFRSEGEWPSSLPNLQSITLGTTESVPSTANHLPALHIPRRQDPTAPFAIANLTELRLNSNPKVFIPYPPHFNPVELLHLQKLDISGLFVGGEFALPASLQYLRIRGGAAVEALPFTTEDRLRLPNLETLILSDVPWVTNDTLLAFLVEAESPLTILHVDSCFRLQASLLTSALGLHAKRLTTLNVSHIIGVDDAIIEALIGNVPTLKVLNTSYTNITGVAIKMIVDVRAVDRKAQIECLYITGCEQVSHDAVVYGRANGLYIFT